jgi:cell division protein FtsQ
VTSTLSPPRTSGSSPRPSLSEQLSRQRAFRRRVRRAVVAVLVVALVVSAIWVAYFSRVLDTRTVSVSGTRDLPVEQVTRTAAVPLGLPLARQDLNGVARRTTTLPAVSSARVTRSWPHTVHVAVTEREALFGVARPDGFLVVDKEGVGFAVRSALPADLIRADVDPGNRPLLDELGTVALALPPAVRDDVQSISVPGPDAITLRLSSGVVVTWGDATESPLKARVLTALLERKPKTSVDVSSPHNPATR